MAQHRLWAGTVLMIIFALLQSIYGLALPVALSLIGVASMLILSSFSEDGKVR